MLSSSRPEHDQIEVTLFGPGFGECCLVHYGSGDWLIIDSCLDVRTGEVAALRYLNHIGVDLTSVKYLVASHWHADHVKGLGDTLRACTDAQFCASGALTSPEFLAVMAAYDDLPHFKGSKGTEEFFSVVEELKASGRLPFRMLSADTRLKLKPSLYGLAQGATEIWALSPSPAQHVKFLHEIASLMPTVSSTKTRLSSQHQNDLSVALLIVLDEASILLGADLEETGEPTLGWSAVVRSQGRPTTVSSIFKVPHHGSSNGHCSEVWSGMLVDRPISILTPYTRLKNPLPTADDQARLVALSSAMYVSARPKARKTPSLDSNVTKLLRGLNMAIPEVEPDTGAIRIRNGGCSAPSSWTIELADGAYQAA